MLSVFVVGITCAILAGCVTTAGGTLGDLSRSDRSAAADLQSVALALDLYSKGESTQALTGTALDDAVADLTSQQESVSTLGASTSQERKARSTTLAGLDSAVKAAIRATEAVDRTAGAVSVGTAREQAKRSAARLKGLAISLEKLW